MRRRLILIATVWPLVYALVFMYFVSRVFATGEEGPLFSPVVIGLCLLAFLTGCVLLAVHLVDVHRNRELTTEQRLTWTLVLVLIGGFAMPVYWCATCAVRASRARVQSGAARGWCPSRSSKPVSRRSPAVGRFDSCAAPLR